MVVDVDQPVAIEGVVAVAADQRVVAGLPAKDVCIAVADQHIVAGPARQIFDSAQGPAAAAGVLRAALQQQRDGDRGVVAVVFGEMDGVAAIAANQQVVAGADGEQVIAVAAVEHVVVGGRDDRPEQPRAGAPQPIVVGIAGQAVGEGRSRQVFDAAERVPTLAAGVLGAGDAQINGRAAERFVGLVKAGAVEAVAADDQVIAVAAGDVIVAAKAVDILVAVAADQAVIAFVADDGAGIDVEGDRGGIAAGQSVGEAVGRRRDKRGIGLIGKTAVAVDGQLGARGEGDRHADIGAAAVDRGNAERRAIRVAIGTPAVVVEKVAGDRTECAAREGVVLRVRRLVGRNCRTRDLQDVRPVDCLA